MAIEPMLSYNAESWQNMPRKTMKALNDLYSHFYRCIFRIGSGCPVICFYWQCGTLRVNNIILLKKLIFIHHLANLPLESLGREIFDLQLEEKLPGLVKENEEHLDALEFRKMCSASKRVWKQKVR